jgi:hypothetical protein
VPNISCRCGISHGTNLGTLETEKLCGSKSRVLPRGLTSQASFRSTIEMRSEPDSTKSGTCRWLDTNVGWLLTFFHNRLFWFLKPFNSRTKIVLTFFEFFFFFWGCFWSFIIIFSLMLNWFLRLVGYIIKSVLKLHFRILILKSLNVFSNFYKLKKCQQLLQNSNI